MMSVCVLVRTVKSKYDDSSIYYDHDMLENFAQMNIEDEYAYYLPVAAMIFLG